MKKHIKSVAVLFMICAVVSVLLAVTNNITSPIIEKNEQANANAALLEVLADGGSFELVDTSAYTLPASVSEVYRASNGGYVIKLTVTGYNPGMVIMCGITSDGKIAGTKVIASAETPAIGGAAVESFSASVLGADASGIDLVDTVAGATKTTAAYKAALKDALNTVLVLGGAEIDLRTEEEIFADNLKAALPSADGRFTKHFFSETVEGVEAIYTADNGTGHVVIIGESFIGVDSDGKASADISDSDRQIAEAAVTAIKATTAEDIDLTKYEGLPTQLISAKKTNGGCYVIEIKGVGYGILGGNEWHPASGEYIIIKISLTAEGKVIDCLTLSQGETNNLGSACAEEWFYSQFAGKTEENYKDIDAIGGATVTTDGYKEAVMRAFSCVKIFEGGIKE